MDSYYVLLYIAVVILCCLIFHWIEKSIKEEKRAAKERAVKEREEEREMLRRQREEEREMLRRQREEERERAWLQREEERERLRRQREEERELLAEIRRDQRAREKEFNSKDKRMSKIESQLYNPSGLRELCSAIDQMNNLEPDERDFLANAAQHLYPAIRHFQQSGEEQCLIEFMDKQIDIIRAHALRPIGFDEFAKEAKKIINPFEANYQNFPQKVKRHYNEYAIELYGRSNEK